MAKTLKDIISHFYNGSEGIISGRYTGSEERLFFRHGWEFVEFTPEQAEHYKKSNRIKFEEEE